jgi:thioredoxin reductase
MHDVIIIGGSYAGMAAALQLARVRKAVLVVDAGRRRNRFARHPHGFLGQDGQPGEAIAARGRAEVLAYSTVTWREATATAARPVPDGFVVHAGGEEHRGRRLILATGVTDELPAIPGLAERWGGRVFFCPYCDAYELGPGRLGILATSPASAHFALLVADWAGAGQARFFLNGAPAPQAEERAALLARAIAIEPLGVIAIAGEGPAVEVRLEDGRVVPLDALFLIPRTRIDAPFAEQLGCELEMGSKGPLYKTDATKETTVPGVFACGDAATTMHSVAFAVADGVRAGLAAHHSLVWARPKNV